MKLRGPLFAPADSTRKADKALASFADAVILDLEDSVAASAKDAARGTLVSILAGVSRAGVIVRINPPGTPWYLADLAAVVPCRPAAVMLPKCDGGSTLLALDHHLEVLEAAAGIAPGTIGVLPIATETAASVIALTTDPPNNRRVIGLCFGAEDLSAELGVDPRDADGGYAAPVSAARAAVVLAAAVLGVPALDTPWPDPRDPEGLVREARQAARDGFAGKLCIHPDQLGPVHDVFTPSPERLAWARRVRDAFAASPAAGVLALDGKMIDQPHLKLALRLLGEAE